MRSPHRLFGLTVALALITCLAFLAACAPLEAISPSPTPSDIPGSPTLNGCGVQQAPANLPSPDVILTWTGMLGKMPIQDVVKKVAVRNGQVIEVQLPASDQWGINAHPGAAILRVEEPQSWYTGAASAECAWRLTAIGAGTTRLDFNGGTVCPPGRRCLGNAVLAQYEITVA